LETPSRATLNTEDKKTNVTFGKGKDVDMKISSASVPNTQGCARVLNSLSKAVEEAIRSAGHAYRFAPNSHTAEALSDAVALQSLMALLAARVAAIADDDQ
jgi:hypothetical protein